MKKGEVFNTYFNMCNYIINSLRDNFIKYQDNIALATPSFQITYDKLFKIVKYLSKIIKEKPISSKKIAIFCKNPMNISLSILTAMFSNCTYIPIETNNSLERLEWILSDSDADCLITDFLDIKTSIQKIYLNQNDLVFNKNIDDYSNIELLQIDCDEIYNIYTSGTTGTPKGVRISYKSLNNYLRWFVDEFSIKHDDVSIILTSLCFDLSYTTFFSTLCKGGKIILLEGNVIENIHNISDIFKEHSITFLKATPTIINKLITQGNLLNNYKSLRLVISGGEPVIVDDIGKLIDNIDGITCVNHYGPTETTIGAIYHIINKSNFYNFRLEPCIGYTIPNVDFLIKNVEGLEKKYGELLLCGDCVSLGYVNNIIQNQKAFKVINGRVYYHTGDIVYQKNDKLFFVGRIDNQVKIKGYRVEPKEIEIVIKKVINSNEVIVLSKSIKGENEICAYIDKNNNLSSLQLREKLSKILPKYMIPKYFYLLKDYKVNPNGKILYNTVIGDKIPLHYSTCNNSESIIDGIMNIYSNILEINKNELAETDDFYSLGGDSLDLITLSYEIEKKYNIRFDINQIMNNLKISKLAKIISSNVSLEHISNKVYEDLDIEVKIIDNSIHIHNNDSKKVAKYIYSNFGSAFLPDVVYGYKNINVTNINYDIILEQCNKNYNKLINWLNTSTIINEKSTYIKMKINSGYTNPNFIKEKTIYRSFTFKALDEDAANNILNRLFKEQSVMRIKINNIQNRTNEYLFSEYKYLDLKHNILNLIGYEYSASRLDEIVKDSLLDSIAWDYNSIEQKLFYNYLIVKKQEYTYKLFIIMDYLISDSELDRIIKMHLSDYYEENIPSLMNSITDYQNIKEQSTSNILDFANFKDFMNAVSNFYNIGKYNRKEAIIIDEPFSFTIPLPSSNRIGKLIKICYNVINKNFNLETIPLRVFYNKRWFSQKEMFFTIGSFSDTVPVLINKNKTEAELQDIFDNNLKYLNNNNLSFKNYKDSAYIYDNYYLSPFSLNYLGDVSREIDIQFNNNKENFLLIPYSIIAYSVENEFIRIIVNNGTV